MTTTKPTLTICITAKESICGMTAGCFFDISHKDGIKQVVNLVQSFCIGQSDLPKLRSEQVSNWFDKAEKDDVFMFIDADQLFVENDILRSLFFIKQYDVVCGAYARRSGEMTVEPKDRSTFYKKKEGELFYGATGFMMISYRVVEKMVKHLGGKKFGVSNTKFAYPLFYERVVNEREYKDLWLGEDYSFCWLARQVGATIYGYISPTIGHIIPTERYVSIPNSTTWSKKSIVIYCGKTAEKWSPRSLSRGVGGSELALLRLTPYWFSEGYSVTIYCECDEPGIYDGIEYRRRVEFNFMDRFNILIVWRGIELLSMVTLNAKKVYSDLHDIVKQKQVTKRAISNVTKFCVKSKFHAGMLEGVDESKIAVIPNGGACEPEGKVERDPNYLIYTSSYDRGIPYMLYWGWPKIKKACPNAYLKIFYGWNGFDASVPKTEDTQLYKETVMKLMEQEGVEECGRISQKDLLMEKQKANIHYYLGDFQEIDCISIRESACMGAIPVVSNYAEVFREKPYCIRVDGHPQTKEMQEKGADLIIDLLQNPEKAEKYRQEMPVPFDQTWESTARQWMKLFEEGEEE